MFLLSFFAFSSRAIFSSSLSSVGISGAVIPAGCGTLTTLTLDGAATGLSTITFSDSDAQSVDFSYYDGSGGDDCASGIFDCDGICDGSAVEDCGGVCGGSSVLDECDVCDIDPPPISS